MSKSVSARASRLARRHRRKAVSLPQLPLVVLDVILNHLDSEELRALRLVSRALTAQICDCPSVKNLLRRRRLDLSDESFQSLEDFLTGVNSGGHLDWLEIRPVLKFRYRGNWDTATPVVDTEAVRASNKLTHVLQRMTSIREFRLAMKCVTPPSREHSYGPLWRFDVFPQVSREATLLYELVMQALAASTVTIGQFFIFEQTQCSLSVDVFRSSTPLNPLPPALSRLQKLHLSIHTVEQEQVTTRNELFLEPLSQMTTLRSLGLHIWRTNGEEDLKEVRRLSEYVLQLKFPHLEEFAFYGLQSGKAGFRSFIGNHRGVRHATLHHMELFSDDKLPWDDVVDDLCKMPNLHSLELLCIGKANRTPVDLRAPDEDYLHPEPGTSPPECEYGRFAGRKYSRRQIERGIRFIRDVHYPRAKATARIQPSFTKYWYGV